MHTGEMRRRNRGGALLIATILVVVMVGLLGLLLAAPNAQMTQVSAAVSKDRSVEIADAGVRDAIVWIMNNKTNLGAWLVPNPPPSGTATLYVTGGLPANPGSTTVQTAAAVTPAPPAGTTIMVLPTSGAAKADFFGSNTNYPNIASASGGDRPIFHANNFIGFGDRTSATSANGTNFGYAYMIQNAGNGYYRVVVEGRSSAAAISQSSTGSISNQTVSTFIVAYIENAVNIGPSLAPLTFMNPTNAPLTNHDNNNSLTGFQIPNQNGQTPVPPGQPPVMFMEATGVGPDKFAIGTNGTFVSGVDAAVPPGPTAPGAIMQFGQAQFASQTSPAVGGANGLGLTVDAAGTSSTFSSMQNVIQAIRDAPPGTPGVLKQAIGSGVGAPPGSVPYNGNNIQGNLSGINYFYVPTGQSVPDAMIELNGNQTLSGIVVVDLAPGAVIPLGPGGHGIYRKNGNPGGIQGTLIFNQQGPLSVSQTGIYLADLHGAPKLSTILQWNSVAVANALTLLPSPVKLASYSIKQ